jgi:hypothetical protein
VNKRRLGRILTNRLKEIHRSNGVDIEIHESDLGGLIVGWLRRTVNDRIELVRLEKLKHVLATSNIEVEVFEILRRRQQTIAIPCRITLRSEKDRPHVVVDAEHLMT